jgi:hypothetical protein
MSDIFFNFVNEPTYHVFEWVRGGGLGDVPRLIARAYEKAEKSPWLEMGEDICTVVRDTLAYLLWDAVAAKGIFPSEGLGEIDGAAMPVQAGLTYPLLMWALQQIRFHVVAEALLRDARKWHPSTTSPRAI